MRLSASRRSLAGSTPTSSYSSSTTTSSTRSRSTRKAERGSCGGRRHWANVPGCGAALVIAEIAAQSAVPVAVLAGSVAQAEAVEAQLRFFAGPGADIALFPDLEILP